MRRISYLIVVVWAVWPGIVDAKRGLLKDGDWEYQFDDTRISSALLASVMSFSGHSTLFADSTAGCPIRGLRAYAKKRGWEAWPTWGPDWLEQARIAANHEIARVAPLQELKIPSELASARSASLNALLIHHEIDLALFELLDTNDVTSLERPFLGLTPGSLCEGAIKKIRAEPSRSLKFRAAQHDWNNCVIGATADYPSRSWKAFLIKYRIKETRHTENSE